MAKNNLPILPLIQVILLILLNNGTLHSQVVFEQGTPPSFKEGQKQLIPIEVMPALDYNRIIKEDKKRDASNRPFKFGHLHKVDYTLKNSGKWMTLDNGDRVWQLKIYAPDALTINLNYRKFDLPIGGKLYIYNESKTDILGPFTHQNEKSNKEFATGFTRGEHCIIEYHEPLQQKRKGVIEISGVVHGYRSIRNHATNMLKSFQVTGECNYDVGCSLGDGWEDQIKSVVMILTEDNIGGCTGTLINTTANDCEPYLLTADHCFEEDNVGDELNNIFLFNYDSPDPICPGISQSPGPTDQTVHGCTIIAKSGIDENDFCLLKLANNPIHFYDVYYAGWDRTNVAASGVVGIHHGNSEVKKISLEEDPVISSDDDKFWLVKWDFGTTEPGASGSSIFDINSKRILGQLCCGNAACDGNVSNEGEEDFGKMYYSWDQIGPNDGERLKPWLDPINSGVMFIDGNSCFVPLDATFNPTDGKNLLFCEPTMMKLKDQTVGKPTSWSWTFSGAGVSPSTSNEKNPEVTVNSGGTLMVSLTVSNASGTDMVSQSYPVSFHSCLDDTYCATPNQDIPDNSPSGISSSVNLPMTSTLIDLNVEVDISHEYIADLLITLEHEGTTAILLSRPNHPIDDCFNEDITATFDDDASLAAQSMCNDTGSAISGFVIPFASIAVFDDINPEGTWTLTVADKSSSDEGVLNSWCIKTTAVDNECFSNLTHANGLQQTENGLKDYESSNSIITTLSTTIENGATIRYNAADFIELNTTFEVKSGATFEAIIDGCDDGATPIAKETYATSIPLTGNSLQKRKNSLEWIHVQPIPTQNWLSVAFTTTDVTPITVDIFDINGRLILQKQLDDTVNDVNRLEVDVRSFAKGMYLLQLNNSRATIQHKFVTY